MTITAAIVRPTGPVEFIELEPSETYQAIKEALDGGYFTVAGLPDRHHAYVDDDGLRKMLPINERLTALYGRGPIVGTGIIFGPSPDGEEHSITPKFRAMLQRLLALPSQ